MSTRLVQLEIEGFRGFSRAQLIDLNADTVVIRGDNGTGKTSLVDALLWLFCGELTYLADRIRLLRRTEDIIINRFSGPSARVVLTLSRDGAEQIFTRSGSQNDNILTAIVDGHRVEGVSAETQLIAMFGIPSTAELQQAVLTWGLLRQDAIRVALDQTGGALHERIAGLVGLEHVSSFARATSRASELLTRQRTAARASREALAKAHSKAVARRDAAKQATGSPSQVEALIDHGMRATATRLASHARIVTDARLDARALEQLNNALQRAENSIAELHLRQRNLSEHPVAAEKQVRDSEDQLERAASKAVEAAQRAPSLIQLATVALDLLGDHCPVCEQAIDEHSVRKHLEELLESSRAQALEARASQDTIARTRAELAAARENLAQHRLALNAAEKARSTVNLVLAEVEPWLHIEQDHLTPPYTSDLLDALRGAIAELRELQVIVNQASPAQVALLASECETATEALANAERQLADHEERCKRAKIVENEAHRAAEAILEDALNALRPSFAEVFDRLAPNPAFTELLARQDVMRNRNQIIPTVRDPETGTEANPAIVFSEGQLNVVALSYFLGMSLNAREAALPFLVLDDPLQALDVIAMLGFSDLCRQIRERRQLIVTTHDRRFGEVLVRKLSPRSNHDSLVVHDFDGWGRDGPVIHTSRPEVAPIMRLLAQRAS